MRKTIDNKYDIREEDITEVVKRVKVLLINSNEEVLLGYSNNCYQFPGGSEKNINNVVESKIKPVK